MIQVLFFLCCAGSLSQSTLCKCHPVCLSLFCRARRTLSLSLTLSLLSLSDLEARPHVTSSSGEYMSAQTPILLTAHMLFGYLHVYMPLMFMLKRVCSVHVSQCKPFDWYMWWARKWTEYPGFQTLHLSEDVNSRSKP